MSIAVALRSLSRPTIATWLALSLAAVHAANYRIEPTETTASFEVWLIAFIPIRGHFKRTGGALRFDPIARSGYIEVAIDTTTLEANTPRAQATARDRGFFNVEKYPRVEFKSSRFIFEGDRLRAIEGMLTLTGTTQPVTLVVDQAACKPTVGGEPSVCRADASFTVKRSAFGMKSGANSVGDEVTIRIDIVAFADEAIAKPLLAPPVALIDTSKQP